MNFYKDTLSLIISVVIIFSSISFFSISAFAQDENTEESTESIYLDIEKIVNVSAGVKITLKGEPNSNYYVYKKTDSTEWVKTASSNEQIFIDSDVKSNTIYYYLITSAQTDTFEDENSVSILFLSAPVVSPANTENGVKVSWKKIDGATSYAVYRKISGGSYSKIATTSSASYLDTTALKSNQKYYYTVKAYFGKTVSGYSGKGVLYLSIPTLKISNYIDGVDITWNKVSGAEGYYVFKKLPDGSYSKIATTTSLSYLDKSAKNGTNYIYTVRAYKGDTKSCYKSTEFMRLKNPVNILGSVNSGIKISWNKVVGAKSYEIYRKTSDTDFKKIATTTLLSYIDTTAKLNVQYSYAVKSCNGNFKSSYSSKKITVNKKDGKLTKVVFSIPVVSQRPDYPTGCEGACANMVLKYYGINISLKKTMSYIPCGKVYKQNGKTYGPSIYEKFVGDPTKTHTDPNPGHGAFAPVITKALNKAFADYDNTLTAKDITGASVSTLYNYVAKGQPIIVWSTYHMQTPTQNNEWYIKTPNGDKLFKYPRGTHVTVMVGCTTSKIYLADPWDNKVITVNKSDFESKYKLLGKQAIIVERS